MGIRTPLNPLFVNRAAFEDILTQSDSGECGLLSVKEFRTGMEQMNERKLWNPISSSLMEAICDVAVECTNAGEDRVAYKTFLDSLMVTDTRPALARNPSWLRKDSA